MSEIGFIGLGNMGLPMARNLVAAGHAVVGFDVVPGRGAALAEAGGRAAAGVAEAVASAEVVITMLPAGEHVRAVYLEPTGVLEAAGEETLLIDCSTIDVATARAVEAAAAGRGLDMIDAPVSGGVHGAESAGLTLMAGGTEAAFARALPVLQAMGKAAIHTGPAGTGQAAKICNNMMLGIQMISVAEAFALAERLGLEPARLFEVVKGSSGQCWSMTSYCPVPGLVPTAPVNREFRPGFSAAMMLKDLDLAQDAARSVDSATPLGTNAAELYRSFTAAGNQGLDFSAIIKMIAAMR